MWKRIILPVLFMGLLLCTKAQNSAALTVLNRDQKETIVNELSEMLQQNYVYPDTARAMAKNVQAQWQNGA